MIDELITDIKSDRHNIIYDKPKVCAISYYTMDIYNADINHPLHKFWFYIPKAKIIERTKNYIILALSNNDNDIKLVKYIDELENKILKSTKESLFETIKKIKKSFNINENYPPTIKLDIRGDIPIFNNRDETVETSDLKNNSLISIFLELDNVMASFDEVWIFWRMLQIKILDSIDLKKSFFKTPINYSSINLNSTFNTDTHYIPIPIPPPPPPITIKNNITKMESRDDIQKNKILVDTKNSSGVFTISKTEILDQITKLKKVSKEKEQYELDNNADIFRISELKKVETREPLEMSEWFTNSLEMEILYNIANSDLNNIFFDNISRLKKIYLNKIEKINKNYKKVLESFNK